MICKPYFYEYLTVGFYTFVILDSKNNGVLGNSGSGYAIHMNDKIVKKGSDPYRFTIFAEFIFVTKWLIILLYL